MTYGQNFFDPKAVVERIIPNLRMKNYSQSQLNCGSTGGQRKMSPFCSLEQFALLDQAYCRDDCSCCDRDIFDPTIISDSSCKNLTMVKKSDSYLDREADGSQRKMGAHYVSFLWRGAIFLLRRHVLSELLNNVRLIFFQSESCSGKKKTKCPRDKFFTILA